jgi:hypothetical protein
MKKLYFCIFLAVCFGVYNSLQKSAIVVEQNTNHDSSATSAATSAAKVETPPTLESELKRVTADFCDEYLTINNRSPQSLIAAYLTSKNPVLLAELETRISEDPRIGIFLLGITSDTNSRLSLAAKLNGYFPDDSCIRFLYGSTICAAGSLDDGWATVLSASKLKPLDTGSRSRVRGVRELLMLSGLETTSAWGKAELLENATTAAIFNKAGYAYKAYKSVKKSSKDAIDFASQSVAYCSQVANLAELGNLTHKIVLDIEKQALLPLERETPYGNSGQTVEGRLKEINDKIEYAEYVESNLTPFLYASPKKVIQIFLEKRETEGTIEAMKWLDSVRKSQN